MSPNFILNKHTEEQKPLDFTPENYECYNEPFTYDELLKSLKKIPRYSRGSGPNPLSNIKTPSETFQRMSPAYL